MQILVKPMNGNELACEVISVSQVEYEMSYWHAYMTGHLLIVLPRVL